MSDKNKDWMGRELKRLADLTKLLEAENETLHQQVQALKTFIEGDETLMHIRKRALEIGRETMNDKFNRPSNPQVN